MTSDRYREFYTRLNSELFSGISLFYGAENWDRERFGPCPAGFGEVTLGGLNTIFHWLGRGVSLVQTTFIQQRFTTIEHFLAHFAETYSLLEDEYSRSLLIRLIAFRILGYHRVKLPMAENIEWYRSQKKTIQTLTDDTIPNIITSQNVTLKLFHLDKIGFPLHLFSNRNLVLPVFLLKQYQYRHNTMTIAPAAGDYVIDAGAGWGDSALFFSHMVGPHGKVFSFDFVPENLALIDRNFCLNPELAGRIDVIPHALWNKTGESLNYRAEGVATNIVPVAQDTSILPDHSVSTLSIDDFILEKDPIRLDFIKMDIEGAELMALQGAIQTIRRFRPVLAIAIYHSLGDLAELPLSVHEMCPDYALFLDHFTIHEEETILFAVPYEKMGDMKKTS